MEIDVYPGTWKRIAGAKRFESVEIDEHLELKVRDEAPLQLRPDKRCGALVDDGDVSVTYWQRSAGSEPQNLLMGIAVEPGKGAGREWEVWGGKISISRVAPRRTEFLPSLKPVEFLRGVWRVRVEEGRSGGRHGDYVLVVAGRKPDDRGEFPPRTRYWLCYSEGPDGPWVRYDVMTFNKETGSLDSIFGHRSVSMMEAQRPSRRVIYAMFYKVPKKSWMPFEVIRPAGEDDGSGAWGAEGG